MTGGPRYERILVPHDFSPAADAALEAAIGLAKSLGSELHLLHVYHRPVEILSPYEVPLPQSVVDEIRTAAKSRLERALEPVREAGLTGTPHVVEGIPAEAISETARTLPAQLVVMGTRGLSGLKHVLLGSVAERTLRGAPCPVLTVKAPEDRG